MPRSKPPVCKRRGCDAPRSSWQFLCAGCWGAVPWVEKQRYLKVARAKLSGLKAKVAREIIRALGAKPDRPAPSAQAYARTAALLGERSEVEAAE